MMNKLNIDFIKLLFNTFICIYVSMQSMQIYT